VHSNESRKQEKERTAKTLAKYEFKMALIEEWEPTNLDPEYVRQLKDNANKLRQTLIVKGVIFPFEFDQ